MAIIYVDIKNISGTEDGSEAHPYNKIQNAVDAANAGDTLKVLMGIYNENITMKDGVVIQGSGANVTTIDGGGSGSVVTALSVDSKAKLDGFTLTNGKARSGGGIYLNHSSPTITNCIISSNGASYRGGAIYGNGSSPVVSNNVITHNTAYGGGGIFFLNPSSATISNNIIMNNSCAGSGLGGGGIYLDYTSNPKVLNNIIANNDGGQKGGGIAVNAGSPTIINNTIVGNSARLGAGIYNWHNSSATVMNSIIWGNTDPIYLDYSNYGGNTTIAVNYSDVQGGYTGTGNIDVAPLFVDHDPAVGDYHLQSNSPCIGAGDSSPEYNDPDGTRNDMGAYGGPGAKSPDTTPPSSPTINQPTSPTRTTPITVSGTAEANSRVQVFVNGVAQGSTSTDASEKFCIDNVNLDEGDNTITAKAIDAAGNVSEESLPVTVVLDTVPPSAPTLNPLKSITNKTPITVSGTAEPNTTIEIFVNDISRTTLSTAVGDFDLEIALDEGVNTITSTSTDTAGNKSKPSPPISVFYELFPQEPLAYLPIGAIEGIGDVFAEELRKHGIDIIRDLAVIDSQTLQTLSERTDIPMLKLYDADRRAELALSVKVDGEIFEPLLEMELEKIMMASVEELSALANQPNDIIHSLKRGISTLLVALDNNIVKNLLLGELVTGPYLKLSGYELMETRFETDEKASVKLTIKNLGSVVAQDVKGVVTSDLEKLKVLSKELSFGDISKGSVASAKVDLQTFDIEPGSYTLKLVLDAKGVQSAIKNFEVDVVGD